jgi:peptidoglycan/LPS O-acetylase OafA/YrhL
MNRIREFEALRGLLAVWVVLGHVVPYSGYTPKSLGVLSFAATPGLAVDVFIILSGFVIFDLIDTKHESYVPFIVRRFFRIFPLYIVALIIGTLFSARTLAWTQALPWKTPFVAGQVSINQATITYLPLQFFAHLTALQGLLPDKLLPFSEYAVVGQAWSISVEWQFYLVAPLLYFALKKNAVVLAVILMAIIAMNSRHWLSEGFAINQAQYFLTGISCYFIYKRCPRVSGHYVIIGGMVATALAFWFTLRPISLGIWAVFFASALHSKFGSSNPVSGIAATRWPQLLGKISYSIYLLHIFVFMLISAALLKYFPATRQAMHFSVALSLTLGCSILLSWVTFTFIEKPGMDLGRYVSRVSLIGLTAISKHPLTARLSWLLKRRGPTQWEFCWKFNPVQLIDGTVELGRLLRRIAPDGSLQYKRPTDLDVEDEWARDIQV